MLPTKRTRPPRTTFCAVERLGRFDAVRSLTRANTASPARRIVKADRPRARRRRPYARRQRPYGRRQDRWPPRSPANRPGPPKCDQRSKRRSRCRYSAWNILVWDEPALRLVLRTGYHDAAGHVPARVGRTCAARITDRRSARPRRKLIARSRVREIDPSREETRTSPHAPSRFRRVLSRSQLRAGMPQRRKGLSTHSYAASSAAKLVLD